jgi:hypothetical protein
VNYRQGIFKTLTKCWIFGTVYIFAIAFVLLGMVLLTAFELPKPVAASLRKDAKTVGGDVGPPKSVPKP